MEREMPKAGEVWRHFKGNCYLIIAAARHTETGEMYVVYKALYGTYEDYLRPLDMFMSEVDRVKYPDVKQKYRFEKNRKGRIDISCRNQLLFMTAFFYPKNSI